MEPIRFSRPSTTTTTTGRAIITIVFTRTSPSLRGMDHSIPFLFSTRASPASPTAQRLRHVVERLQQPERKPRSQRLTDISNISVMNLDGVS
jgi:hypothetical protein